MENRTRAKEDHKPYTVKYGPINISKETYGPPTSRRLLYWRRRILLELSLA